MTLRRFLVGTLVLLAISLVMAPGAKADTITLTVNGCTLCSGANLTATLTPTGTPNQYSVSLEIQFGNNFSALLASLTAQALCGGQTGGVFCSTGGLSLSGNTLTVTWLVTLPPGLLPNQDVNFDLGLLGTLNVTVTSGSTNPVPEPGTLALFGLGLSGIGAVIRRRRKLAA